MEKSQDLANAVAVGFFPKLTYCDLDWLGVDSVKEIASVSCCISQAPEGWIERWQHNEFGFYDSEETARQAAGEDPSFDLYAYKLYPFSCLDEEMEIESVPARGIVIPEDYRFLGFDIVTRSTGATFECSPLSCNHGAREIPVNEFCLIQDREAAYAALQKICKSGNYEPGPYYLFEVYRKAERY